MILASHGIIASQIQSFVGLLDLYPSAAAAYSLRKLMAAYSGSAIRVRRSSDNAEQNIGFIGGNLDTSALTTFCSGTNGFVTTWYDQSGNGNNATQTTAINQPQIVSAGNILLDNGKPTIFFNGTNNKMDSSTINFKFVFGIINPLTAQSYESWLGYVNKLLFLRDDTLNKLYIFGMLYPNFSTVTYVNNTKTINFTNSLLQIFSSGENTTTVTNKNLQIGYDTSGGAYGQMNCSEIICYTNDQTSNRSGINTNINTYYAIY
jgi:hypothetical protein